jgi:hypothetical protein
VKLAEVYAKYSAPDSGGDKGTAHSYIDIYEAEMTKRNAIALLEIGIYEGHSIAMWQEYFQDSEIIGIDIDLSRVKFDLEYIIEADATSLIPWIADKKFDYIIDDGSHEVQHQVLSFDAWWPTVKAEGKYFIEDIKGDPELNLLQTHLSNRGIRYKTYDNRRLKGRSDDILIVATK